MAATHSIESSYSHSISASFNKSLIVVRDQGVGGSNPLSPTIKSRIIKKLAFCQFWPVRNLGPIGEPLAPRSSSTSSTARRASAGTLPSGPMQLAFTSRQRRRINGQPCSHPPL